MPSRKSWENSKPAITLKFPSGRIRADIIRQEINAGGYKGAVVFTSGHVATDLRKAGIDVLEVGPNGSLKTDRWWTPAEIRAQWPDRFDATSGHLSLVLMARIGAAYKALIGRLEGQQLVPSGSGETIVCLGLAYPEVAFAAVYDNSNPATTRDNDGPLNAVVDANFPVLYWHGLTVGEERK